MSHSYQKKKTWIHKRQDSFSCDLKLSLHARIHHIYHITCGIPYVRYKKSYVFSREFHTRISQKTFHIWFCDILWKKKYMFHIWFLYLTYCVIFPLNARIWACFQSLNVLWVTTYEHTPLSSQHMNTRPYSFTSTQTHNTWISTHTRTQTHNMQTYNTWIGRRLTIHDADLQNMDAYMYTHTHADSQHKNRGAVSLRHATQNTQTHNTCVYTYTSTGTYMNTHTRTQTHNTRIGACVHVLWI